MKKFIPFVWLLLSSIPLLASFHSDGVYYEFISDYELEVTSFSISKNQVSVVIPSEFVIDGYSYRVSRIGNYAFLECENVVLVTLPTTIYEIGHDAFSGCKNLLKINFPSSLTKIGDRAFYGCESLESIKIQKKVESIGFAAFANCRSLNSVAFSNGVSEIKGHAFENCKSLTSIDLPNSLEVIEYGLFTDCENLREVILPKYVEEICYNAFKNCVSLDSIYIPKSIREIEYYAFMGCSGLKTIVLAASEYSMKIGMQAFVGCGELTEIQCLRTKPPHAREDSFENYNATVIVPCRSKSNYESDEVFSLFSSIECDQPLAIDELEFEEIPQEIYNIQGKIIPQTQSGLNVLKFQNGNSKMIFVEK